MNKILFSVCFTFSLTAWAQLQSPDEFLGYALGDRFTRHHRVVEYFQHVAAASPNVKLAQYGETYEHRPLVYAVVASTENMARLEEIRLDNLKRTGLVAGNAAGAKVAIVWLSYNVHGNEANSMEASMKTLYELVNPSNNKTKSWLANTVIIIDPCLNPDGRDRYANFYNQYGNQPANASGDAKEHREPWPGGRANHYLFDLNRDWAWLTQQESQARLKIYQEWMPHVHVDFHEQGYNNPYYFAPAAEPFHEVITPWQREFQTMIGKNNARYFDEQGWLYFTKERFDLFYPSYGDTYPTYSGAIGMTYEQGGGGFGGLTITTREGDPLTLKDRLTHHHTAGMSTVEITAANADKVVTEFEKYFKDNNNAPSAPYKTYVIKADNQPDKIRQLTQWMDKHGIRYGHPSAAKATRGFDYQTQTVANVNVATDDIVISAYQPKGRFVTTLFEPQSKLTDSATYDITAWNLMYSYNLKAFALNDRILVGKIYQPAATPPAATPAKPYAYLFKYQTWHDVAFLAQLLKKDIAVRAASRAFTVNGQSYNPGTLIVTRRNNESVPNFDETIRTLAQQHQRTVYTATTGFVESGKDFGSSDVGFIKAPRIATLVGDQTSSLNAGEIWYFFERQLQYPITQIGTDYFKNVDLNKYDVLIVPNGYYRMFDDAMLEQLGTWVSKGGKLILVSGSLSAFNDKKGFKLRTYTSDAEKSELEKLDEATKVQQQLSRYEDAERQELSASIFGAVYKVNVDNSHPLGYGFGNTYFTLKDNESRYGYLENGYNVGVVKGAAKPLQGFAGYQANKKISNSLVFGAERKGQGQVVYLIDNPLFRCFWESGKMLFGNAVFMVGVN